MSNLIRGPQDFLLNTVTGKEIGMYVDSDAVKHLVIKKYGIDIPASAGTNVIVKTGQDGNKQKVTLALDWLWNNESRKVFDIEVTRQPLYTGFGNDQFPVSHTYSFKMSAFVTGTVGTIDSADKKAIIDGLVDAIDADTQLNSNAVNTGAVVAASNVGNSLVLEALEEGTLFTVRVYDDEFTQTQNVPYKKATLTNDSIMRIFSVKEENAGQRPYVPTEGVDYACVTINQRTAGYDNVVASGNITRDQIYNIYVPVTAVSALEFATVTNLSTNEDSMADVVGSPAKSLYDYLDLLGDVTPVTVTAGAITGVTAPVKDAAPVKTVTGTTYTGTVAWTETVGGDPVGAKFAASTAYTATVTLTPNAGYTFLNIAANGMTIDGGTAAATSDRGSNVSVVNFAATAGA